MIRRKTTKEISEIADIASEKIRLLLDDIDFTEQARRNTLYKKYADNKFHHYVEMEINRYIRALEVIKAFDPTKEKNDICDYGCMIPFLPYALSIMGYQVSIVDKYDFYGQKFKDSIRRFCTDNNINN